MELNLAPINKDNFLPPKTAAGNNDHIKDMI